MVSAAFSLYDIDNFVPLAPFGVSGVLKGSVAAFFGFLGFDEVRRDELPGGEKSTLAWANGGGVVGAFAQNTRENIDRVAHSSTSVLSPEHLLPVHGRYPYHQPPF